MSSRLALWLLGADDRARTGDLHLGKVSLSQLSYIRRRPQHSKLSPDAHSNSSTATAGRLQQGCGPRVHRQVLGDEAGRWAHFGHGLGQHFGHVGVAELVG